MESWEGGGGKSPAKDGLESQARETWTTQFLFRSAASMEPVLGPRDNWARPITPTLMGPLRFLEPQAI